MPYHFCLIEGDGIGPEVIESAVKVLEAAKVKIKWENLVVGEKALKKYDTPLPPPMLAAIRQHKIALKGPVATPVGRGFPSVNVALRKEFNLFANLRPVKSLPGVPARYEKVDLLIVRENTEGLYSGIEHKVAAGVVESIKVVTQLASTRIAEFAFKLAKKERRKKVTVVHKANIMKLSDGLFLECARKVSKKYPQIQLEEMIVDNASMQLVLNPWQFDILLLENLYGDIVSDLAAGLVGGLGLVAGANLGEKEAIFEPVHGSAPKIAGIGKANPIATLFAAIMMLRHIGETKAANKIEKAIQAVLKKGKNLTEDLKGKATTQQMTQAIISTL